MLTFISCASAWRCLALGALKLGEHGGHHSLQGFVCHRWQRVGGGAIAYGRLLTLLRNLGGWWLCCSCCCCCFLLLQAKLLGVGLCLAGCCLGG